MRSAIDAAGAMMDACGRSFAVQYLLDDRDMPAFIAAGEPMPTQRMVAKQCSVTCGIVTSEPADVLIVNAHPRDSDLWQAFKCIPNTRWAARPNGVIICLARCEGGTEGMNVPRWPLSPFWVRRVVRAVGPNAVYSLLTRLVPSIAGDAAFFVRLAAQSIHRNPILMVSPALHAAGVKFPGLSLLPTGEDAVAAAQHLLGAGQQRVIVFPAGGTTFPAVAPPAAGAPRAT